jgi:hypothetical protein
MLLCPRGVGLGRMHGSVAMFRRGINSIEAQGLVTGVDDVMARASRHENSVVALDLGPLTIDPDLVLAFFNAEELIAISVDFLADLFAWFKGHENKLEMLARIHHPPKIRIVLGQIFDICDKSLHDACLLLVDWCTKSYLPN